MKVVILYLSIINNGRNFHHKNRIYTTTPRFLCYLFQGDVIVLVLVFPQNPSYNIDPHRFFSPLRANLRCCADAAADKGGTVHLFSILVSNERLPAASSSSSADLYRSIADVYRSLSYVEMSSDRTKSTWEPRCPYPYGNYVYHYWSNDDIKIINVIIVELKFWTCIDCIFFLIIRKHLFLSSGLSGQKSQCGGRMRISQIIITTTASRGRSLLLGVWWTPGSGRVEPCWVTSTPNHRARQQHRWISRQASRQEALAAH